MFISPLHLYGYECYHSLELDMKIIITGGAGFLGSHLCERLIDKGHQIICIDNLLKGKLENLEKLKTNPNFQFFNIDVTIPEMLNLNLQADQIYHLASVCSPNPFRPINIHKLPFETMRVNTFGTWQLCEMAMKNGAKFLFASTSEVYGNPLEHPQKEDYKGNVSTTEPRSVYDEAKRFGETIVSTFVRSRRLDGRIVRIFNTYGPKMNLDDGRVVIEFLGAALTNKPLYIFGDGTQTRSFCYVSDLIEGLIAAMEKGQTGNVYNLGNPEEISVLDLAYLIKKVAKSDSKIQFRTMPFEEKGQTLRRKPDILKAKKILRWSPMIKLEDGLNKTVDFINNQL